MSQKENGFAPWSSRHYEIIAESIADDDNVDGWGNDFAAAMAYFRAARLGRKEEKKKEGK